MNINCTICSELFITGADIYFTQCGHVFHFQCLVNWLERSKSCPQCRGRVTEKSIYKVYFNVANTDNNIDANTLLFKLDGVNFTLVLKEKEIKNLKEEIHKLRKQSKVFKEEIVKLENAERSMESTVHAYKEQISYFKTKSKESDRLSAEIVRLKSKIKDMENLEIVINGTREQVDDILREDHNAESLALLAAILKKSLLDSERKVRDIDYNFKKLKNELSRQKKENTKLESSNADLRRELQQIKIKAEKEKVILKQRLCMIKNNSAKNNIVVANPDAASETSNINEEDLSYHGGEESHIHPDTTLSVSERVENIENSDSPYLPVKSNFGSYLYTKYQAPSSSKLNKPATATSAYTLLETNSMVDVSKGSKSTDVAYDGLGGSTKEDIYPAPKQHQSSLKRNKSSSSTTSNKFRKLAPLSNTAKVTEFFRSSQ